MAQVILKTGKPECIDAGIGNWWQNILIHVFNHSSYFQKLPTYKQVISTTRNRIFSFFQILRAIQYIASMQRYAFLFSRNPDIFSQNNAYL